MTAMKAAHPRVSFADMEKWPEDGRRYELYDGEVYEVPSPIPLHQMVSGHLYLALADYVNRHGGTVLYAPLDIVLTEYDVVQPDLILFTRERAHLVNPRRATRVPPDLAIEILSPSTKVNDRGRKLRLLQKHGVREFWLVDPESETIEIYSLSGDQYVLAHIASGGAPVNSPLLPFVVVIYKF
jgi:Uma2 family endonuclease